MRGVTAPLPQPDGGEDDEESEEISPDVGDTRGGADDVVVWNEALTRERVIDDALATAARSSIDDGARHLQGIGN